MNPTVFILSLVALTKASSALAAEGLTPCGPLCNGTQQQGGGQEKFTEDSGATDMDGLTSTDMDDGPKWRPADTWGYKMGLEIHFYWLGSVIPIGWVGNIISFAVLSRPKNRKISCCIYMCGLAVADSGMLSVATVYYLRMLYVIILKDVDMNTHDNPRIECKLLTWFFQVFSLTSICIIICMTADRFISVQYPLKVKQWCTPSRALKIVLCIPLITCTYTLPYFFLSDYIGPTCTALAVGSTFTKVYSWITICLNCFIPFLSILVLNSLIIIRLLISRSSKIRGDSTVNSNPKGRESQVIIMLLMVSFTFLILTSPLFIRYLAYQYIDQYASEERASYFHLFYSISNKMYHTNYAINFILYCIGGSKFREDLRNLFRCAPKEKAKTVNEISSVQITNLAQ